MVIINKNIMSRLNEADLENIHEIVENIIYENYKDADLLFSYDVVVKIKIYNAPDDRTAADISDCKCKCKK